MAAGPNEFCIRHQPWELRHYEESEAGSDSDEAEPGLDKMSYTQRSTEFLNMLVHLKVSGILSAKEACILSFWARKGGLCDPGGSLAVHPSKAGGAFSKHFDKTIGLDQENEGRL